MSDITWQEFFDVVLLEANKGDTLKDVIPGKVFQAVRSLEQNWSYKWNEKLLEFQIDQTLDNPNILELPEDFKSRPQISPLVWITSRPLTRKALP